MQSTPFNDEVLRDWFFDSLTSLPFSKDGVATMGSDPFSESSFDDFLYDKGLSIYIPGEDTETLIIGRDEWVEENLEEILDMRAGKQLKVYSQEMFLSYLASGRDPFENEGIARKFGEGHPALEFLAGLGFDWPKTFVASGNGDFVAEMPPVGLLSYKGYKVGKSGLLDAQRQEILREVFNSRLPPVFPKSYLQEWGSPFSKERLQKMANSLAAFCRNEKRKSNPSEIAIEDWENDLEWLRRNFHIGRFRFQWPSIYVR